MSSSFSHEELFSTIKFILNKCSNLKQPWAFTGSVGQYIQGMDLHPHDVDIQTNKEGAYALNDLLAEYVTEGVYFKESPTIKSFFGVYNYNDIKIEIMGDIQKCFNQTWSSPPDLNKIIIKAEWKGEIIPVIDLAYEYTAYIELGRPERAEQIKRFLDQSKNT